MKMKKFERAYIPKDEQERITAEYIRIYDEDPKKIFEDGQIPPRDRFIADLIRVAEDERSKEIWKNDIYQVSIRRNKIQDWPDIIHLSIKRIDKETIHDWRELQEIKNLLVGPEAEAVELYPAESRLVDSANQYHLWCIEAPNKFPFGFHGVRLVSNGNIANSKQRSFT
jgi:hypothetical protein